MGKYRTIKFKGKKFDSVAEFAQHYGMDPKLVLGRLYKGKTPYQAISQPYSNHVKIRVGKKHFKSIAGACRYYGFSQHIIQSRLKRGWSPNEAFQLKKRPKPAVGPRARSVKVFGKTYPSLKLLAEAFGISVSMIQQRTRELGMSHEEAVSFQKVREVTCHGKTYPSIAALAREYSLNAGTVTSRIKRGMSPAQAVTAPVLKYQPNKPGTIYLITNKVTGMMYVGLTRSTINSRLKAHFKASAIGRGKAESLHEAMRKFPRAAFKIKEIDHAKDSKQLQELEQHYIVHYNTMVPHGYNQNIGGAVSGGQSNKNFKVGRKSFVSYAEACRYYGINESTCLNRIKRGWPLKKAFTTPPENFDTSQKVEAFGRTYPSLKAASEENNADYKKVFYHVKHMDEAPEQAIKSLAGKSRKVVVEGVEYPLLKNACEAYGVKLHTVLYRIRKKGMTLEEAITTSRMKNQFG